VGGVSVNRHSEKHRQPPRVEISPLHTSTRPPRVQRFTHRRFGHVDAHKKQKLCDEEVDAQVLVDGVAIALEAAEEAEGEDANGKADK